MRLERVGRNIEKFVILVTEKSAGDELLIWASEEGSGKLEKLYSAMDFLKDKHDLDNLKSSFWVKRFSELGHLDIDWEERKWSIAEPTINLTPGMGLLTILTGSRPYHFERAYEKATDGLDYYNFTSPQPLVRFRNDVVAPKAMFVSCSSVMHAETLAEKLGVKFVADPAENIISSLSEEKIGNAMRPFRDAWKFYDPATLSYNEKPWKRDDEFKIGLYEEDVNSWRHSYLWFDGESWSEFPKALGEAKALSFVGKSALTWLPELSKYGRINQASKLEVAAGLTLPDLVERALVMCCGFLPEWKKKNSGEEIRVYLNVPKGLVQKIEKKVGLEVRYG